MPDKEPGMILILGLIIALPVLFGLYTAMKIGDKFNFVEKVLFINGAVFVYLLTVIGSPFLGFASIFYFGERMAKRKHRDQQFGSLKTRGLR